MDDGRVPAGLKSGSRLERVLAAGRFAVTVEIVPPASPDPTSLLASAKALRGYADAFNVTDSPRASVRMAGWAASSLLLREGLEPVMQIATRDRNRIALQADVLGAAALGVRNVLCMSGDDPTAGNEPEAAKVDDLDTRGLIEALRDMRDRGRLRGGDPVDPRPKLFIGTAATPLAGGLEDSFAKLRGKVEAGADFVQTQGVFDVGAFEEWVHLLRKEWLHEKVHLLAGVIPLRSAKGARFVTEKLAGAAVPADVVAKLDRASNSKAAGIRIAVETVEGLRRIEGVHGVHLMAVGWEEAIPTILRETGLHPRPDA